jgi:hypothetical protein
LHCQFPTTLPIASIADFNSLQFNLGQYLLQHLKHISVSIWPASGRLTRVLRALDIYPVYWGVRPSVSAETSISSMHQASGPAISSI